MDTKTLSLTVAYIGSDYHGFARQEGLPTVQGELENALSIVFRHPVETVGAGRTDAGVHAHGQTVSFHIDAADLGERQLSQIKNSLNALTPDSISIRAIIEREADFSARFSAIEREYRYRLVAAESPALFLAPYVWWLPDSHINLNKMREAASYLEGEHDFKSFCVASSAEDKNTVREIKHIHIFGMDHLGEPCLVIQVIGNAFLHSMVRIIVGSLVDVGYSRREPEWVKEVLAGKDRRLAGQTAPAQGLTLWQVRY